MNNKIVYNRIKFHLWSKAVRQRKVWIKWNLILFHITGVFDWSQFLFLKSFTESLWCRSVVCRWEEQLVINEVIHRFTSEEQPVMFFFQLMDFPGQAQGRSQAGWLTFAWAFLRVRGDNGRLNMGQRLRLQLWRPRRTSGVSLVDLYGWWKSGSRLKYPSTLYISLEEVTLPSSPTPALRSLPHP